jgi:hypothetical protein
VYPTAQSICGLSGGELALPDFASVAVFHRTIALYSRLRIERGWLAEFQRNKHLLTAHKLYPVADKQMFPTRFVPFLYCNYLDGIPLVLFVRMPWGRVCCLSCRYLTQ